MQLNPDSTPESRHTCIHLIGQHTNECSTSIQITLWWQMMYYFRFVKPYWSLTTVTPVLMLAFRSASFLTRGDLEWMVRKTSGNLWSGKSVSRIPSRITYTSRLFNVLCWNMLNIRMTPCRVVSVPTSRRISSVK